jgi:ketosteroid isomerase-like protein
VTATTAVQADQRELLLQAYAAYNSQDLEALVALVSDDVDWPDDGGRLHGKDEVRALLDRAMGPHAHPRRAGELHPAQ